MPSLAQSYPAQCECLTDGNHPSTNSLDYLCFPVPGVNYFWLKYLQMQVLRLTWGSPPILWTRAPAPSVRVRPAGASLLGVPASVIHNETWVCAPGEATPAVNHWGSS